MASLKVPVFWDSMDSKKFCCSVNSALSPDRCSFFPAVGYVHLTRVIMLHSISRGKHISVFEIEPDITGILESEKVEGDDVSLSPRRELVKESLIEKDNLQYELGKRYRDRKKESKRVSGSKNRYKPNVKDQEVDDLFVNNGEVDVNYSALGSDLSLEKCNVVLKRLERSSDNKILAFFDWMRSNGKLEQNMSAYNFVLQMLGRRGDWDEATKIIREVQADLGSELNLLVFNTLIYKCYKSSNVEMGAKWFRMMLKCKVQPNIAVFGMLMGLCQKGLNINEGEFAFSQMRDFGISCQTAYSSMITIYTRLRLYEKAVGIIHLMIEDRVILNLENWLVTLNVYCQQGRMEDAEKVLVSMVEAGFSRNIIAYNTVITGYGKISNMNAAHQLFLSFKDIGIEPDETTYRSMIEGWGRAGNYNEAEWYYKELKRLGHKPNSSNLYTLLNLEAKFEVQEGALRTINDMLNIGCQYSSILSTILRAYERAGNIKSVPLLLKGSFYQHVLINQTSFSSLVLAYVKHSMVEDAMRILREKEWKDQYFEENLYHLLICTCKESGRLEDAIQIYNLMPKCEDKPNLHIICTIIDIYSNMGRFADGEKLYLKLRSSGTALDLIAHSIVVRMYVKAGSLEDACSVLDAMEKQQDIVPDVYLIRDMLRIYQRCEMFDKAAKLYYKILKSGLTWDAEMYNCVINCCARALPVDELSRLFDEMLQNGFAPNNITSNIMLDVYGKSKLFNKARELLSLAQKNGWIDEISYNTVIAAYGKNKDFKSMSSTVRKMKFNGFSVSLEAYNCMLDAYGKVGEIENFRKVLQKMKESSCESDHYTYNILINIYGQQGWINEVAETLTELKDCGLQPDLYSYNTMIKAYGIAGMVEEAVLLVKDMREKGIKPDRITYINMITALRRNDEFLEAVKWSLWMKQMNL